MKKRCPFCRVEIEIPETVESSGFCGCGAYALITLLSDAHHFSSRAKKALGVEPTKTGRTIEVVDGGTVFEEKGEPAIIQWAKKPQ